jgi:hypothetical protein
MIEIRYKEQSYKLSPEKREGTCQGCFAYNIHIGVCEVKKAIIKEYDIDCLAERVIFTAIPLKKLFTRL